MSRVSLDGDCWLWTGQVNKDGYGLFWDGEKTVTAHRWSFFNLNPEVETNTERTFVCHTCDTPGCVNPTHLFLATAKENSQDMVSKGRSSKTGLANPLKGSDHGMHKLEDGDVIEIRRIHKEREMSLREIAGKFGVSYGTITDVVYRKSWRHI